MTFDRFLQDACPPLGLVWRKFRRRSARHRVDARLRELGISNYCQYLELIRSDALEAALLPDLMRVTVSRFFREKECWQTLSGRVLPLLLAGNGAMIRAWSAGCCGGEEPYTLAMVWLERIAPYYPGSGLEIIASDIDEASLERARAARFENGSLREVPPENLARYFTRDSGQWSLAAEAKALVRLEMRNIMHGPLPSMMDLVLCRYLAFTYYREERLLAATARLWGALRPGGCLMVGKKENLPRAAAAFFEPWPGCECFYRRKELTPTSRRPDSTSGICSTSGTREPPADCVLPALGKDHL